MIHKLKAILGGEDILSTRTRIIKVLAAELAKFGKLIATRVAADHSLVESETAVSLGDKADSAAEQGEVRTALEAIKLQALRLTGLRSTLAGQAAALEAHRSAVKAALPNHEDGIRRKFSAKWDVGVAAFGQLMGERDSIESLTGKLTLPAAVAIRYELPDSAQQPYRAIVDTDAAIEELAGWARAGDWAALDARAPSGATGFDKDAVYVTTHPQCGVEVGTLVMAPSFAPNLLQHLHHIGYAACLALSDWQKSLEDAGGASARAAAELQRARDTERHAQDVPWLIPYDLPASAAANADRERIHETNPTLVDSYIQKRGQEPGPQRRVTGNM